MGSIAKETLKSVNFSSSVKEFAPVGSSGPASAHHLSDDDPSSQRRLISTLTHVEKFMPHNSSHLPEFVTKRALDMD